MNRKRVVTGLFLVFVLTFGGLLSGCPLPADPLYSFAVIADPHLYGDAEYEARIIATVDWINANAVEKEIELVFLVGDIAWGSGGQIDRAKEILDGLTVPYVPIVGDNELHGSEVAFNDVFGPHYDELALELTNWQKNTTPVWNPDIGADSYFQNFSFDHKGNHFMGIDWCSRIMEGWVGEQADRHDFEGGTWPWFTDQIATCPKPYKENIIMLSHHPMHVAPVLPVEVAAFSVEENMLIETFTAGYGDYVYANLAGHYHVWWQEQRVVGQFDLYVTAATHIGENNLKLVRVYTEEDTFTYTHEQVIIP